jgi:hypothetical protein
MSNPNRKPVNFKSLHIVHAALCAGVILFLITAVFINQQALIMVPANDNNSIIIYIAIVMAVVSTILGYILFNIVVSKIDTSVPVNQKLPKYLSACIVRYALIEGGALFNVAVFLITGCLINAGIAAILALLMISLRPQRQQFITDLKVNYPESID